MGQRSQIYIKMFNPVKELDDITPEYKKALGRKNTTILPFHNQWMYGHFSLVCALNVLNHCIQIDPSSRKLNKDGNYPIGDGSTSPFCPQYKGLRFRGETGLKRLISQVEFITNYVPNSPYRGTGMMGAREILSESIENGKYNPNWNCANDPLTGDNNDGILVIDFVECKYCFVNISNYTYDEVTTGPSNLEYLKPSSALEYFEAYNPTSEERLPEYNKVDRTPKEILEELEENIEMKEYFEKEFSRFEVMTETELYKMFPKFKDELTLKLT